MSDKAIREDAIRNGLIDRWADERRKMLQKSVERHGLDPKCVDRELNVAQAQLPEVTNEKLLNGEDASIVETTDDRPEQKPARSSRTRNNRR